MIDEFTLYVLMTLPLFEAVKKLGSFSTTEHPNSHVSKNIQLSQGLTSHLGDSGMKKSPASRRTHGTKPEPKLLLVPIQHEFEE